MALGAGLKAEEMQQVEADVRVLILANLVTKDAGKAGWEGWPAFGYGPETTGTINNAPRSTLCTSERLAPTPSQVVPLFS